MFGLLARLAMSSAVVMCVRAMVTVAVSFALRLFHTRLLWGVPCSDVRLDEVELELLLGLVLGAMRCVYPWDEDENNPCLRSWDGSCGGGNCGWSGAC